MDMSGTSTTMDMGGTSTTMNMAGMTATTTSAAASSTASTMNMGGNPTCKISMLWNWYTIDSCFIAKSWHITSTGMFAGSCIGVILLTMALELLRRSGKEYDRYLVRKGAAAVQDQQPVETRSSTPSKDAPASATPIVLKGYRPSILEQAIRALIHMVQFAVAYFIMLLAMYYNGYIIICIFIGAYLGAFIFQWETLGGGSSATSAATEVTVCCG